MSEVVLSCRGLKKTYQGPAPVHVLLGVDLDVRAGERIAIMGRSGSGKSTLLHLLGGLDVPSEGTVALQGRAPHTVAEAQRGPGRTRAPGSVDPVHHRAPDDPGVDDDPLHDEFAEMNGAQQAGGWRGFLARWGS